MKKFLVEIRGSRRVERSFEYAFVDAEPQSGDVIYENEGSNTQVVIGRREWHNGVLVLVAHETNNGVVRA